jgi:hypothetical protein
MKKKLKKNLVVNYLGRYENSKTRKIIWMNQFFPFF